MVIVTYAFLSVTLPFPTVEQCKLGIVKFIEAEQVPELEAVIHLVVASSDTRHSVATAADLELKSKQRYKFGCLEKVVLVFLTKLAAIHVVLQRDCSERRKVAVPHLPARLPCIHAGLRMLWLSLAAGDITWVRS